MIDFIKHTIIPTNNTFDRPRSRPPEQKKPPQLLETAFMSPQSGFCIITTYYNKYPYTTSNAILLKTKYHIKQYISLKTVTYSVTYIIFE